MLVLSRKRGERITIGPNIELIVLAVRRNCVELGFDAPPEVTIHREEVFRRTQDGGRNEVAGDECTGAGCR
jgi:carbon storage regulator